MKRFLLGIFVSAGVLACVASMSEAQTRNQYFYMVCSQYLRANLWYTLDFSGSGVVVRQQTCNGGVAGNGGVIGGPQMPWYVVTPSDGTLNSISVTGTLAMANSTLAPVGARFQVNGHSQSSAIDFRRNPVEWYLINNALPYKTQIVILNIRVQN